MPSEGHLFVVIHGLWGGPHHVSSIEESLKESLKDHNVYTLLPKNFAYFHTYDGVKSCGNVVIEEIFEKLIQLDEEEDVRITRISFVGYSLGGLIARYCIGELTKLPDFFTAIKPMFFSTFATPHLGIRFFDRSVFHFVLNTLGASLLGKTGRQLFIVDSEKLLVKLLEPEGPYYKGLLKFEKRILLSNVRNDRTVPFYTGFVTRYQPFTDWDNLELKYLKNPPGITVGGDLIRPRIVDFKNSIRKPHHKTYTWGRVFRFILVVVIVIFVVPIWFPTVFIASLFGTVQSWIRESLRPVYNIEEGWAKVTSKKSSKTNSFTTSASTRNDHPIEEEFAELTENYVEGVLAANDRLHNGNSDGSNENDKTENTDDNIKSFLGIVKYNFEDYLTFVKSNELYFNEDNLVEINKLELDILKENYPLFDIDNIELNMDEERLGLIENFDSIPFVKLPVYIDSFNAHDGIVSRRGVRSTPRGVATILLWCSILKQQLVQLELD